MELDRLQEIIRQCTLCLRKGDVVTRTGAVTEVFAMPATSDVREDIDTKKVDVHFIEVAVCLSKSNVRRADLAETLASYPYCDDATFHPLKLGPNYIEVGAAIGSQEQALRLFALGKVLGFWDILTPGLFGIEGTEADEMAGAGMVMISGYRPPAEPTAEPGEGEG